MIVATEIEKRFSAQPEVAVLHGLSLEVAAGESVAITGASGSGKSTLLHILGGLDRDFEGRVAVDGLALDALDDRDLAQFRNATVGFVFQAFHLLDHLTVLENVALPAWFASASSPASVTARAEECLVAVGLAGSAGRRPNHLSGGEKQRVGIARALFSRPRMLLCDEPTGALDEGTSREILDLFDRLHASEELTRVTVTHDRDVTARADRVLCMRHGKLHPLGEL
jgi:putative ABC transport system ATP-binding protein